MSPRAPYRASISNQRAALLEHQVVRCHADRTAEALVKSGQAGAVRDHIDHLASGGYA